MLEHSQCLEPNTKASGVQKRKGCFTRPLPFEPMVALKISPCFSKSHCVKGLQASIHCLTCQLRHTQCVRPAVGHTASLKRREQPRTTNSAGERKCQPKVHPPTLQQSPRFGRALALRWRANSPAFAAAGRSRRRWCLLYDLSMPELKDRIASYSQRTANCATPAQASAAASAAITSM